MSAIIINKKNRDELIAFDITERKVRLNKRVAPRWNALVRDYFKRLGALRVNAYDTANARLIDRLNDAGFLDSGTINAMAGYLFPGATLIPLVAGMDAGTLVNFVTGDWNAVTGNEGNGIDKYANTNRNNNADGQDDQSAGVFVSERDLTVNRFLLGAGEADGRTQIIQGSGGVEHQLSFRSRSSAAWARPNTNTNGYMGLSRNASGNYYSRAAGTTESEIRGSSEPDDADVIVYDRAADNTARSAARISLYHVGPSLTPNPSDGLALMDTILTDWMAALAAA